MASRLAKYSSINNNALYIVEDLGGARWPYYSLLCKAGCGPLSPSAYSSKQLLIFTHCRFGVAEALWVHDACTACQHACIGSSEKQLAAAQQYKHNSTIGINGACSAVPSHAPAAAHK